MAENVLTMTKYMVFDSTVDTIAKPGYLNVTLGTSTFTADRVREIPVTAYSSSGTKTWRGFYFGSMDGKGPGGKGRRLLYSFDYRFVSSTDNPTAVINPVNFEGSTAISLTMDATWKTASGVFTRPTYAGNSALVFYTYDTSFPLGTYYIRNLKTENLPWVLTIGGKPLKISV